MNVDSADRHASAVSGLNDDDNRDSVVKMSPRSSVAQPESALKGAETAISFVGLKKLQKAVETDPDLTQVLSAWPDLDLATRKLILRVVSGPTPKGQELRGREM
jgi:hypothetical protein